METKIDIKVLKNSQTFERIEPLKKGWSEDNKYIIYTKDNKKLLLRISDKYKYDEKFRESQIIKKISEVCDNTPKFVDIKISGKKVLQLYTFLEGKDALEEITNLSQEEQFALGREAGRTLKKIHSADKIVESKEYIEKQKEKILDRTKAYENSIYCTKEDKRLIKYIQSNIEQLNSGEISLCHGDYHLGNMIINDNKIYIIDFNRFNYEDKYKDFIPMFAFTRDESVEFAKGQLDGYFNNKIPVEFWCRVKLFLAYMSLYSILWAEALSHEEVEEMIRRKNMVYNDFIQSSLESPKWMEEKK